MTILAIYLYYTFFAKGQTIQGSPSNDATLVSRKNRVGLTWEVRLLIDVASKCPFLGVICQLQGVSSSS